jgi:hypothetical protein
LVARTSGSGGISVACKNGHPNRLKCPFPVIYLAENPAIFSHLPCPYRAGQKVKRHAIKLQFSVSQRSGTKAEAGVFA